MNVLQCVWSSLFTNRTAANFSEDFQNLTGHILEQTCLHSGVGLDDPREFQSLPFCDSTIL